MLLSTHTHLNKIQLLQTILNAFKKIFLNFLFRKNCMLYLYTNCYVNSFNFNLFSLCNLFLFYFSLSGSFDFTSQMYFSYFCVFLCMIDILYSQICSFCGELVKKWAYILIRLLFWWYKLFHILMFNFKIDQKLDFVFLCHKYISLNIIFIVLYARVEHLLFNMIFFHFICCIIHMLDLNCTKFLCLHFSRRIIIDFICIWSIEKLPFLS